VLNRMMSVQVCASLHGMQFPGWCGKPAMATKPERSTGIAPSEWQVCRSCEYTGITPRERISDQFVRTHQESQLTSGVSDRVSRVFAIKKSAFSFLTASGGGWSDQTSRRKPFSILAYPFCSGVGFEAGCFRTRSSETCRMESSRILRRQTCGPGHRVE